MHDVRPNPSDNTSLPFFLFPLSSLFLVCVCVCVCVCMRARAWNFVNRLWWTAIKSINCYLVSFSLKSCKASWIPWLNSGAQCHSYTVSVCVCVCVSAQVCFQAITAVKYQLCFDLLKKRYLFLIDLWCEKCPFSGLFYISSHELKLYPNDKLQQWVTVCDGL